MIDHNELMLNNWLHGDDPGGAGEDVDFQVRSIDDEGINLWQVEGFSDERACNVRPIAFTPEWLKRCGLNFKRKTVTGLEIWECLRFQLVPLETENRYTDFEVTFYPLIHAEGRFLWRLDLNVHRYQNLYRSLTQTELQIKL